MIGIADIKSIPFPVQFVDPNEFPASPEDPNKESEIPFVDDVNRYEKFFHEFSENGRHFARLLSKDNARFLYKGLPKLNSHGLPLKIQDVEDDIQDFFLSICCRKGNIDRDQKQLEELDDVDDDSYVKNYISRGFRLSLIDAYQRRKNRYNKPGTGKKHSEFLFVDNNPDCLSDRLERISIESYVQEKTKHDSGLRIILKEEGFEDEIQYRKHKIYEIIHDALPLLTEPLRKVVELYYLEGLSVKEITKILNKSKSNVNANLCNARKKLKDKLPKNITETRGWVCL
ncbi:sigma-70 family RNA polymerase sigma factor [Candidatus Pacearchaeota archaeon]|nr:sigma-70 family RNA polymerase sigma factor [Candidatus Pacearchaeota archaeon]